MTIFLSGQKFITMCVHVNYNVSLGIIYDICVDNA